MGAGIDLHKILFHHIPTNDTWCRDFGPISAIKNGDTVLFDFQFNAWGNRYAAELDNAVSSTLYERGVFTSRPQSVNFVLEGGSIESDGAGTLLTTEACLLNENRNSANKSMITDALLKNLPVSRVLWLKNGALAGDDTDSHIDNLARFTAEDTIVYAYCNDSTDPYYETLHAMSAELTAFRRTNGEPYKLKPLTLPKPKFSSVDGRRLPASYVNFLIINDAVLVPQFNDPADTLALNTLMECFPNREIIGIDSLGFIEQNGGIHCLTMQFIANQLAQT